jgi:hypothetical protein
VSADEDPMKLGNRIAWALAAAAAMYLLGLLLVTISGRITYPYDLEWMEGGMLHHAQRISDGKGIYTPPSVEFIPYLYTPLYPAVLAVIGKIFGIGYGVGRAVSVLSLVGMGVVTWSSFRRVVDTESNPRFTAAMAACIAMGVFASGYPLMEGWYDLVRADTLFLFMVTLGVFLAARWSRGKAAGYGHRHIALVAVLMAMSFFCKQTGIFYVAWVGVIVVAMSWRRAPTYAAIAGVIGLGGVWLLNQVSHGWFWTYVYKMHQTHDFNKDRFWKSFDLILMHSKSATAVLAAGILVVLVTAIVKRKIPAGARPLLLWAPTYAVSVVVGAVGWGTEFAHYNAFMPAFLHGGIATAAAVLALAACVREFIPRRASATSLGILPGVVALAACAPLSWSLYQDRWQTERFVPSAADRAAGDALIARIEAINGDVWVPFHPWYSVLAGKPAFAHKMGLKDVTWRSSRIVDDLVPALTSHRFAAVVFDNRSVAAELPLLRTTYRPEEHFAKTLRPRVLTGASVVPDSLWLPSVRLPDGRIAPRTSILAGVRVLFDFETAGWQGWERSGPAWGNGPTTLLMASQEVIYGFGGEGFATSYGSGDAAVGRVTSPLFTIDGDRITMRLAGGTDDHVLRVELVVDGITARTAWAPEPASEEFHTVTMDVARWRGKQGKLVLVDEATGSWGHLSVDDVLIWPTP